MSDFITLYTDAGYYESSKEAYLAFAGKCNMGKLEDCLKVSNVANSTMAELLAMEFAVKQAVEKWPELRGFFINCDNQSCVHMFWEFNNPKPKPDFAAVKARIMALVGKDRFIRTKWVKGHQGKGNIRGYRNNKADQLTWKLRR